MRIKVFVLAVALLLGLAEIPLAAAQPLSAQGQPAGRYQAVPTGSGVFILDTQEGHMWIWFSYSAEGGGHALIYQGRLAPGKQMGDTILRRRNEGKQ